MSLLKPLRKDAVARAFEKAERYRLLSEPFEAESICLDILAVEPDHTPAVGCLLLSLTDQFNHGAGQAMERARALLARFPGEYERAYYAGIISERFAKRKLRDGHPGTKALAYGHLTQAMAAYEKAEQLAPTGNDDAVLRFNACVRMIERHELTAPPDDEPEPQLEQRNPNKLGRAGCLRRPRPTPAPLSHNRAYRSDRTFLGALRRCPLSFVCRCASLRATR